MSAWPWMKGIDTPIVSSVDPPLNEHDTRPSVLELIEEHKAKINQVRQQLVQFPLYEETKHDDLWILRFLLSHKLKVKPAVAAATKTLQFRAEHNLDEHDLRELEAEAIKNEPMRKMEHHCGEFMFFTMPDRKRGVVAYYDLERYDQNKAMEVMKEDEWLPMVLPYKEWSFQWADYVTRTTGRLTKSIRIMNLKGIKASNINRECSRMTSKVMAIMDDYYPQALQTLFLCGAPTWFQVPWRIIRPLLPRRIASKMDFINPEQNEKERKRVLQYISNQNLPERFGGKYKVWPVPPLPSQ